MTDTPSFTLDEYTDPALDYEIESQEMPDASRIMRKDIKTKMIRIARMEKAGEALKNSGLPKPGETLHVISDAKYDFFMVILEAVNLLGVVNEFYGSTWTMARHNVLDLLQYIDDGKIKNTTILTGTYFKNRETAVYSTLIQGLAKRGARFKAFINHTKIVLLNKGDDYIVFEGSANFTANPRLENYIICNDKELYDFHRGWMEEVIKR